MIQNKRNLSPFPSHLLFGGPWALASQDMVNTLMTFTDEQINLDCQHPGQLILDTLTGDSKETYSSQLSSFFESYSAMRSQSFRPIHEFVGF